MCEREYVCLCVSVGEGRCMSVGARRIGKRSELREVVGEQGLGKRKGVRSSVWTQGKYICV